MRFDWDEAKHDSNILRRGYGFDDAARIFAGPVIEWEDVRHDYGERRMIAVGTAEGKFLTVVYTDRGDIRWIITSWPSSPKGASTMARKPMTLDEIMASPSRMDHAKLDATTEEDIRRYQIEDGYDPDFVPVQVTVVEPPRDIRKRLGMTQEQFAEALRVPLATLRNWEQGRFAMDPAVKSLLRIVSQNPEAAFKALAGATQTVR